MRIRLIVHNILCSLGECGYFEHTDVSEDWWFRVLRFGIYDMYWFGHNFILSVKGELK